MAQQVIMVNGLPGSGKTTLAAALGRELDVPVLSRDVLKEQFAELTSGTAKGKPLGRIASETLWMLAGAIAGTVIVESFWFKPRDSAYAATGLRTAGGPVAVELWCDVPPSLARKRYNARSRHPIFDLGSHGDSEWEQWTELAKPLAQTPVIRVDTTSFVNASVVGKNVNAELASAIMLRLLTLPRELADTP